MAAPMPMQAAVAHIRHKGTRPIATIPRRLARTLRPLAPIRLRAAATAAVALLMPVVAEALRTVVVVVELPMAVVAVLTAIAKISAFRKGPPLFNEAGLLLSCACKPRQCKTQLRNSLCACGLN
jgi:hypothetical protein